MTESTLISSTGHRLHTYRWSPAARKAEVLLCHGIAEHGGRYAEMAAALNTRGYALATFDLPGHGRSSGRRSYVPSFQTYVFALATYLQQARSEFPDQPHFLMGHSMGGGIAVRLAVDHPAAVAHLRGMVLTGASLRVSAQVFPVLQRLAGVAGGLVPNLPAVPINARDVSRDVAVVRAYLDDPLNFVGRLPARTGAEIIRNAQYLFSRLEAFDLPVLLLHGGGDRVTDPEGSRQLYARAKSSDKTLKIYPDLYHEIMREPERHQVFDDIADWLDVRC